MPGPGEGLHYICPEFIEDEISSKEMDLWALGCIIYEMISGMKPFDSDEKDPIRMTGRIIEKICSKELQWKKKDDNGEMVNIFSDDARNIIEKLCALEPELRLGAG